MVFIFCIYLNIKLFEKLVKNICQPVWTRKAYHQSLCPGKVPSTQPDDNDDDEYQVSWIGNEYWLWIIYSFIATSTGMAIDYASRNMFEKDGLLNLPKLLRKQCGEKGWLLVNTKQ